MPSFGNSSLAMRSSPQVAFSLPIRRIRARRGFGIGGRRGRDLSRQNSLQPARCQRTRVSGRTATKAPRQSKNRDSNAGEIQVTGSRRRGLAPRSTYRASCRRRSSTSACSDRCDRNASATHPASSASTRSIVETTLSTSRSCRTPGAEPSQGTRTRFLRTTRGTGLAVARTVCVLLWTCTIPIAFIVRSIALLRHAAPETHHRFTERASLASTHTDAPINWDTQAFMRTSDAHSITRKLDTIWGLDRVRAIGHAPDPMRDSSGRHLAQRLL
jgi:hypothetical protein